MQKYLNAFDTERFTPFAIDDDTAIKVVDDKVEVVTEGHWQSFCREFGMTEFLDDPALRTTTDENEARGRDTAAQIASNLAQLKDETLHLRLAQDDTATELGSLRAGVANSEIGVDALRATTGEIRQQIQRIEAARDTTSSIAKSHKHQGHRKWVAQR